MNLRMMRGRVMLHQISNAPSALVVTPEHLQGTRGKRIFNDAHEMDRGHHRANVGRILAIHDADALKYDVGVDDYVLYPQHSAQAPSWDQWDAICDECEQTGRPYPQPPTGWRLSMADANGLASVHGLPGQVVVVPVHKLLVHLPDGMPAPGEVR